MHAGEANIPSVLGIVTFIIRSTPNTIFHIQITISYGEFKVVNKPVIKNLVNIPNAVFDEEADPTR